MAESNCSAMMIGTIQSSVRTKCCRWRWNMSVSKICCRRNWASTMDSTQAKNWTELFWSKIHCSPIPLSSMLHSSGGYCSTAPNIIDKICSKWNCWRKTANITKLGTKFIAIHLNWLRSINRPVIWLDSRCICKDLTMHTFGSRPLPIYRLKKTMSTKSFWAPPAAPCTI